jgi:HD-GYP domain-containing protein (c-di-GMP phosphodiesterase class II)
VHPEQVFRLFGLLAGLAGVTDLGSGGQPDESLHRCLLAARLAHAAGCDSDETRDTVLVSLLQHVGCTAYSFESGRIFGDDRAVTRAFLMADPGSFTHLLGTFVPRVADATGRSRPAVAVNLARTLPITSREAPVATCEVAQEAGRRLGLSTSAQHALGHMTAMWNGKGFPRTRGDEIPLPARIMHVASVATMFWEVGGEQAAASQVRRRSGGELDPELADLFLADPAGILADLDCSDPFGMVLAMEPDPVERVGDDRLLEVASTFGDLVDLKSPWLHGHSGAVARLARSAADALHLSEAPQVEVAGHLHDVGRAGVPSRIWDIPREWTDTERDQARLHAHHTERVLARVPELAGVAELAAAHHERCDGSGYHRGLRADRLPIGARVLATADAWRRLVEDRPHRPGLDEQRARQRLEADVRAGRLDGDAVEAVLHASGDPTRRPVATAGLTARQLEVLRLVTRGLSNREIAARLAISPRTVDRHVADVYTRIGVTSRAAAALYAIGHGLLESDAAERTPGTG